MTGHGDIDHTIRQREHQLLCLVLYILIGGRRAAEAERCCLATRHRHVCAPTLGEISIVCALTYERDCQLRTVCCFSDSETSSRNPGSLSVSLLTGFKPQGQHWPAKHFFGTAYQQIWPPLTYVEVKCHFTA